MLSSSPPAVRQSETLSYLANVRLDLGPAQAFVKPSEELSALDLGSEQVVGRRLGELGLLGEGEGRVLEVGLLEVAVDEDVDLVRGQVDGRCAQWWRGWTWSARRRCHAVAIVKEVAGEERKGGTVYTRQKEGRNRQAAGPY